KDTKQRYSPTNIAFAPDGGFYVGDGYGSHFIHKYTKEGKPEF
ncbi:MAG TPA: peptidase, partial [Planctomycetaceae bacterium]|nr:peptidase [Planctomycetaceae bacterium]